MTTRTESLAGSATKRILTNAQREALYGYLFSSPGILGFLIWVLGPMLASLYLSFTQYSVTSPARWSGLQNYIFAFTEDRLFWNSLVRTLYYAFVMVPVGLIGSLLAAALLNQQLKYTTLWRTLFYLPSLTPVVASAMLWRYLLNTDVGLLNHLLWTIFRIPGPNWLGAKAWAVPALMLISLWGSIGGGRMIIFLAGLQGIPQEMYEAADIDGASQIGKFFHVTLPLLTPTIFFNLVLGVIGALQVFALAFIGTQGGPSYATYFYALHVYTKAFVSFDMGYASALSWLFMIVISALTVINFAVSNRWVFYMGEGRA
ncbi:MAG: sugar ABC transporter permease [Anaerolineae bacterium]|nr:sugar ABC transporter permease [Anaerolineae bacterium]